MSEVSPTNTSPMDERLRQLLDGIEDSDTPRRDQDEHTEVIREMTALWDEGYARSVERKFNDGNVLSGMARIQTYRRGGDTFEDFTEEDFLERNGANDAA